MIATNTTASVVLAAGEGRAYWVWGDRYRLKITGAQTDGAYAVVECEVGPQSGTPPHIHHAEDETFYILDGTLTLWIEGEAVQAGAGSYIAIPRGVVHAWKNESGGQVRMLTSVVPAGFEQFFVAIGTPIDDQTQSAPVLTPAMIEEAVRLAPRFHMEVVG
jgi:quercetin dioxygenase-like cupin family protein